MSRICRYSKHKRIRTILGILTITGFLYDGGALYAQVTNVATNDPFSGAVDILDIILKLVYLILWPLLRIAGKALDNTLVYGAIFHLDAPLRQFWNIMKNFANFALGFLVLRSIIKSIFTFKGASSGDDSPKKIITKTLIAGILIQASWFLTAAVIDVSTVATYAIGGVPMTVLEGTSIGDRPVLSVHTTIDKNDYADLLEKKDGFTTIYSYDGQNISTCKVTQGQVVGRQVAENTIQNYCVLGNNVVIHFNEAITGTTNEAYQQSLDSILAQTGQRETLRNNNSFILLSNLPAHNSAGYGAKGGEDRMGEQDGLTLSSIINESKGFVGPLVTIYHSILDFSNIADSDVSEKSNGGIVIEFIIKALFALALVFPLLALAVVLLARIGFLRLVIAFTPAIVLKRVFKFDMGSLDKHVELKNVLGIIFAPVVIVFALSVSVIFMSSLSQSINNHGGVDAFRTNHQEVMEEFQVTHDDETGEYSFSDGMVTLGCEGEDASSSCGFSGALDLFARLIVNIFAVAIIRGLLFTAIKATSLGKSIGGAIQKRGSSALSSLPIIPLPGGGGNVGAGTFVDTVGERLGSYQNVVADKQAAAIAGDEKLQNLRGGSNDNEEESTGNTPTTDQYNTIATSIGNGNTTITQAATNAGIDNFDINDNTQRSGLNTAIGNNLDTIAITNTLSANPDYAKVMATQGDTITPNGANKEHVVVDTGNGKYELQEQTSYDAPALNTFINEMENNTIENIKQTQPNDPQYQQFNLNNDNIRRQFNGQIAMKDKNRLESFINKPGGKQYAAIMATNGETIQPQQAANPLTITEDENNSGTYILKENN